MIEDQNAEVEVEWAKCFLCQRDTAETLFSSEKLHAVFKKLAGFAAIDEVPSHLLWIKSIKKEEIESTIKDYHPKHHNSCTANYDSLTSPPAITRRQSSASVMGELVCCFYQLMCCWSLSR